MRISSLGQLGKELSMRFYAVLMLFLAFALQCIHADVWGCFMDVPAVSDKDLANAPEEMAAFQAIITKITPDGVKTQVKPHKGFQLELKIVKVFQGNNLSGLVTVRYEGCHNLPGKVGDVINVLASQDKEGGWNAPQFWH